MSVLVQNWSTFSNPGTGGLYCEASFKTSVHLCPSFSIGSKWNLWAGDQTDVGVMAKSVGYLGLDWVFSFPDQDCALVPSHPFLSSGCSTIPHHCLLCVLASYDRSVLPCIFVISRLCLSYSFTFFSSFLSIPTLFWTWRSEKPINQWLRRVPGFGSFL